MGVSWLGTSGPCSQFVCDPGWLPNNFLTLKLQGRVWRFKSKDYLSFIGYHCLLLVLWFINSWVYANSINLLTRNGTFNNTLSDNVYVRFFKALDGFQGMNSFLTPTATIASIGTWMTMPDREYCLIDRWSNIALAYSPWVPQLCTISFSGAWTHLNIK